MSQKFKEGDIVKVVKLVEQEDGWDNVWVSEMDEYIGESGTILKISSEGITVDFDDDSSICFDFPPSSLELIKRAEDVVELSDVERDAMRYRWLRDRLIISDFDRFEQRVGYIGVTIDENESVEIDNAVDAAMKGETK